MHAVRTTPVFPASGAGIRLVLAAGFGFAAVAAAHAQPFFNPRTVNADFGQSRSLAIADIDDDGKNDIVAISVTQANAISWVRNEGGSPPTFATHPIFTGVGTPNVLTVANLGGSARLDVIASLVGTNSVVWFEQGPGSPPTWTQRSISTSVPGAAGVIVADIDGDSDPDVVAAAPFSNSIFWFDSNGAIPPVFTKRTVSNLTVNCSSVAVADLNNDGRPDIVGYNSDVNALLWFENTPAAGDGSPPPTFIQRVVGGAPTTFGRVWTADLDADSRPDVLLATPTGLRWFQNSVATPGMFTPRLFTFNIPSPADISTALINNDAFVDVVVSFNSGSSGGLAWYENDGGATPFFAERIIQTDAPSGFFAARAGDFDADTDADIAVGASADSILRWFEQGAPDFALKRETVDGGGGASAGQLADGGDLVLVRGTIGQHDAAGSSGGGFEVRGGFWISPFLTPCPGDTNGDRIIDFIDLNNVLSDFGMAGVGLAGDVDGDGDCDFVDLNIVLGVFGTQC